MNFLDYIQKHEGNKKRTQAINRNAKMPLLIVLLGEFEKQEQELLKNQLAEHMPLSKHVFWLSMKDCTIEAENSFSLPIENRTLVSVEDRKQMSVEFENDEIRTYLDDVIWKILYQMEGIAYEEIGSIRIAILVKTDQCASGLMVPLAKILSDELSINGFMNIYQELYLLTDQGPIPPVERRKRWAVNHMTISESISLYKEEMMTYSPQHLAHMVYFFSNLKSTGIVLRREDAWKEQYPSIALLLTAKTSVEDNNDMSYSDKDFGNGVANAALIDGKERGGEGFVNSAGYVHLEKNDYLIRLIVYRTVWEELSKIHENLDKEALRRRLKIEETDLRELTTTNTVLKNVASDVKSIVRFAVNPNVIYQKPNGKAVDTVFGKSLDLYMKYNTQMQDCEEKMEKWVQMMEHQLSQREIYRTAGPFDIAELLSELEQEIADNMKQTEIAFERYYAEFEEWKEQVPNYGRRASEEDLIRICAEKYCKKKMEYRNAELEKINHLRLLDKVGKIAGDYRSFVENTKEIIHQLKQEIEQICETKNGIGLLQIANTEEYYERYTKDLLNHNLSYVNLLASLPTYVGKTEIELMEAVVQFCSNEIFTRPEFQQSFLDELLCRMPGYKTADGKVINKPGDICEELLERIRNESHYMCRDIFGGIKNHTSFCCFMVNDMLAALQNQQSGYYIFADKYNEKSDVLYLAGNIYPEQIQFAAQYAKEYENVCKEMSKDGD